MGLALLLVACGGGGDAPDRQAPPRANPRDGYVAQADRICASRQPLREEEIEDPSEAAGVARDQIALHSAVDGELRGLVPPPELRPAVKSFHRKSAEVIGLLREEVVLAESRRGLDARGTRRFNRLAAKVGRVLAQRMAIAERIGFRVCGRPAQGPPLSSPAGQ